LREDLLALHLEIWERLQECSGLILVEVFFHLEIWERLQECSGLILVEVFYGHHLVNQ
jgi:hypothetical protein